jgi:putative DNA primase/helicase
MVKGKAKPIVVGKYELRGNQLFFFNEDNKAEFVCYGTKVKRVLRSLENGKVELELEYWSFDKWDIIKVSRGKLSKSDIPLFLELGMDISGAKAKHVFSFIDLHEKKVTPTYFHSKLGWAIHEEELIYKHNQAWAASNAFSNYDGHFLIEPKGSIKEWIKVVKQDVIGHTPLELMLCAGFSASIVGLFNVSKIVSIDTLLFHMGGGSTTGKTTTAMLAVSPFGNPSSNSNGLIQSYNGTKNAMVGMVGGNYGVPMVFDESSMSRMGEDSLSSFIYELAHNRERARLDKESKQKEINTWSTTVISTGEHSIISSLNANEGLRVRLFEFMNIQWTKNANNSNSLKETLMNNYGHAGLYFVKYIQKLGVDGVVSIWEKYKEYIAEIMPDSTFIDRIASKFAIVLTAGEIANKSLKLGLSIEKIAEMLVEQEMMSFGEREMAPKFHKELKYQLIRYKKNFKVNKEYSPSNQEIWGKIEVLDNKTLCYIIPPIFEKFVKELGYKDTKVLLNKLKALGVLNHDKDKNKTKKVIFNKAEILQRQSLIGSKEYSPKGDYTICVVYDENIFEDYFDDEPSLGNNLSSKRRLKSNFVDEEISFDEM